MPDLLHCHAALALETRGPLAVTRVSRDAAAELAAQIAADLSRLVPGADRLDLAVAGAHYDPCELLRPGWPLHAALGELVARAPQRQEGHVLAFGTGVDAMPVKALEPEMDLQEGPLRLVPFSLIGAPHECEPVAQAMEERLLETGMAGAATALLAQSLFGGALEHARYLTVLDLCAQTALQYEHAGLAPLWPTIEAALLDPGCVTRLDAPPEPLLALQDGRVRIARPVPGAWRNAGLAPADLAPEREARAHAQHLARAAQFAAVLRAHAIACDVIDVSEAEDPRAALRA